MVYFWYRSFSIYKRETLILYNSTYKYNNRENITKFTNNIIMTKFNSYLNKIEHLFYKFYNIL